MPRQPCGHYLRQFGPVGPETLVVSTSSDHRPTAANTYPPPRGWPTRPASPKGGFPSWDCKNTGAAGDGSGPTNSIPGVGQGPGVVLGRPTLPGAAGQSQLPHVEKATYSE